MVFEARSTGGTRCHIGVASAQQVTKAAPRERVLGSGSGSTQRAGAGGRTDREERPASQGHR